MTCPDCNGKSRVLETRETQHGVRRRRACLSCAARFTTVETLLTSTIVEVSEAPSAYEVAEAVAFELDDRFEQIERQLDELPVDVVDGIAGLVEGERSDELSSNGDLLALPAGDDD